MKKTLNSYTLEKVFARTEEYGNCLDWTGYCQNKVPHVQHEGVFMPVRKLVWILTGRKANENHFYSTKCGNPKCVHPNHITERSRKEHMKFMSKKVDHNAMSRIANLCKAAEKRRILTDEQVAQVMIDPRSSSEIAADFNCSKTLICRIKRGNANRAALAKNNPFWQLMA